MVEFVLVTIYGAAGIYAVLGMINWLNFWMTGEETNEHTVNDCLQVACVGYITVASIFAIKYALP